jgi:outer membrane protein assembly factor BamE (lipoprotein component of BamABCDE complex)
MNFKILLCFLLVSCSSKNLVNEEIARRAYIIENQNKISDKITNALLNNSLEIGMKREQVILVLGYPTSFSRKEKQLTWFYSNLILHFKSDSLTDWNSK